MAVTLADAHLGEGVKAYAAYTYSAAAVALPAAHRCISWSIVVRNGVRAAYA